MAPDGKLMRHIGGSMLYQRCRRWPNIDAVLGDFMLSWFSAHPSHTGSHHTSVPMPGLTTSYFGLTAIFPIFHPGKKLISFINTLAHCLVSQLKMLKKQLILMVLRS